MLAETQSRYMDREGKKTVGSSFGADHGSEKVCLQASSKTKQLKSGIVNNDKLRF